MQNHTHDQVELFYLPIDRFGFDEDLASALTLLDDKEHDRYVRYKNKHAQDCYLQARRIAKTELAKKISCQPCEIQFAYNEKEKPWLTNSSAWHFNITHCKSTIAVAIAKKPVGLDAEDVTRTLNLWKKSGDFFNAAVTQQIEACDSEHDCATLFTEHWCCTESYVKQKGSAIYQELKRVSAVLEGRFNKGKFYRFENMRFTVFDFEADSRISVAYENTWPTIKVINWRTGEVEFTSPAKPSPLAEQLLS